MKLAQRFSCVILFLIAAQGYIYASTNLHALAFVCLCIIAVVLFRKA
jgi:hypothetical protein